MKFVKMDEVQRKTKVKEVKAALEKLTTVNKGMAEAFATQYGITLSTTKPVQATTKEQVKEVVLVQGGEGQSL